MTLKEYKDKFNLTLADIAGICGITPPGAKKWCDEGLIAITNGGRELLAVKRPTKLLWSSDEYQRRMDQLGVEQ